MRALCVLCLCLFTSLAQAAISARLDRDQLALGETVTLTLEATGGDSLGQPDLAPLAADFRVLGQSSSSNIQIINGRISASKKLNITLLPKHTGTLAIPTLKTADGNTPALTLDVGNSNSGSTAQTQAANRDLFLEMTAAPKRVLVGQQATLTVRIYYAINLDSGGLDNLAAPGASVQPLGKPHQYDTQMNGQSYRVYEQKFAVFPSDAGKLVIPPANFQGQAITQNSANIWGMPMPGFGVATPVVAASNPVTLTVDAIPADWKGMWLPARNVTLKAEGLPDDTTLTAGTPVNLRLTLAAVGLPATALPDPTLPDLDNASVYADKANSEAGQAGDLLRGSKTRSFAILPQHPGKLVIPAIELPWFNTATGKREVLSIPARTFTVVAGSGITTGQPQNQPAALAADTDPTAPLPTPASASTPAPEHGVASGWRTAFLASLGLWLLTVPLLLWRWRRRPANTDATPAPVASKTTGHPRRRFLDALERQAPDTLNRLLAWAAAERGGITSLATLKTALVATQAEAVARLEHWRYGQGGFPVEAASTFKPGLQWCDAGPSTPTAAPLPPLYPEAGRNNT